VTRFSILLMTRRLMLHRLAAERFFSGEDLRLTHLKAARILRTLPSPFLAFAFVMHTVHCPRKVYSDCAYYLYVLSSIVHCALNFQAHFSTISEEYWVNLNNASIIRHHVKIMVLTSMALAPLRIGLAIAMPRRTRSPGTRVLTQGQ
jgi:hypothetical protein